MAEKPLLYFKNAQEWREWLHENHGSYDGVNLVFYRVGSAFESMRWEEAVKVAICYGWIDSTVRRLDDERRQQLFTRRKDKSVWSKLNKSYIKELTENGLMHESGIKKIETAKKNGSWESLDDVENFVVPADLKTAFDAHPIAFENYNNFSPSYRKNYLYWLNQAKREETRNIRIAQIVDFCSRNIKTRT